MTQLYLLKLPTIYPHLSINSRLCEVYLIFIVRRFYVVSAAAMAFSYSCHTLGQRTAHYPFTTQLAITFPQQLLGINCIRMPRPYDFYDIRSGGHRLLSGREVDEGEHQCKSRTRSSRFGLLFCVHISRTVFLLSCHRATTFLNLLSLLLARDLPGTTPRLSYTSNIYIM